MNVAVRAGAPAQQRLFESMLATEIAKRIIGERATVNFKESDRPASLVDRGDADLALTSSTESPPADVVFSEPYARDSVVAIRKDAVSLQAAVDSVLNALVTSGEILLMATAAGFPYEAP
jgi:hypothetical protein